MSAPLTREQVVRRFWSKVAKRPPDGRTDWPCWMWTGAIDSINGVGYVQYKILPDVHHAHRMAWILTHGPIPRGKMVSHYCGVSLCVRPDHLYLTTRKAINQSLHSTKQRERRERYGDRDWGVEGRTMLENIFGIKNID